MSKIMTLILFLINYSTIDSPIPPEPPVIRAVLPEKFNFINKLYI